MLNEINKLGTNLLTVTNGQTLFGQTAELPEAAPGMIGRIGPVTNVQYTGAINNANAFRSPLIPSGRHQRPDASTPPAWGCPRAVGATVAEGHLPQLRHDQKSRWPSSGRPRPSAWA